MEPTKTYFGNQNERNTTMNADAGRRFSRRSSKLGQDLAAEMAAEEMELCKNSVVQDDDKNDNSDELSCSSRRSSFRSFAYGLSSSVAHVRRKPNKDVDEQKLREGSLKMKRANRNTILVALLLALVGAAAAGSFLYVAIKAANQDQEIEFQQQAKGVVTEIESSFQDYESTAKWMHESCRHWREDGMTRQDFRDQYEYAVSDGLDFFAVQFVPNVTHQERLEIEAEARAYFGNSTLPELENYTYPGIVGLEPNPDGSEGDSIQLRSVQPFYFPILFVEPFDPTQIPLDLWSSPYERPTILTAIETGMPILTPPFQLLGATDNESVGYTVALYHPGVSIGGNKPKDLNNVLLRIHALLERASRGQLEGVVSYLYDATETQNDQDASLQFLGASKVSKTYVNNTESKTIEFLEEENAQYQNLTGQQKLRYEEDVEVGGRIWRIVVVPVEGAYKAELTFIILSGILMAVALALALAVWLLHHWRKSIQMKEVMAKADAESAIVSNLFPETVKKRLLEDAFAQSNTKSTTVPEESHYLTSEGIFGSQPIANLYPSATLLFADLVGFTAWSSMRDPSHVFTLLEIIYNSFDNIAKRRGIFKVETVGDCYVAACGLPENRDDHAVAMSRFAIDCLWRLRKLVKALESRLGPDTGDLDLRVGMNSGPVTAGVLRGLKGRFQLFGDTMNTASRMESTGAPGKIQLSEETAELLRDAGHASWLEPRPDEVKVKGKGWMKTYFLSTRRLSIADTDSPTPEPVTGFIDSEDCKMERLVNWNVEVLSDQLRKIVARNQSKGKVTRRESSTSFTSSDTTILDSFREVMALPEFDQDAFENSVDPKTVELDMDVMEQLHCLVSKISSLYNKNPFHSFQHASHVAMSVLKMGNRIAESKVQDKTKGGTDEEIYQATFGLAHDSLAQAQFACVFSALIHDLDHQGVPNATLVKERAEVALKYQNQSVAERNSINLGWNAFMLPQFKRLRKTICVDQDDYTRFREMVVNLVLATDLMDQDLAAARKERWSRAFGQEGRAQVAEPANVTIDRKATIVLEHLMQASDVSHTMQHWHIFIKWNERLFQEMYSAYKAGRSEKDPSVGWYEGEKDFFDNYIIPLARKLETCGVFGVSKDEYLNYALVNRKEWEKKGQIIVEQYLARYQGMEGKGTDTMDQSLVFSSTYLDLSEASSL